MIQYLFILCFILVLYIYLGYPSCVFLLASFFPRKSQQQPFQADVSILISAYNEEKFIGKTIENKLLQNYPNGSIEIIVISDGSTDGTDDIVKNISNDKLTFIRQTPRQGKTAALNLAVSKAKGDIIVFSDANSIYQSNALLQLINNFSDPEVGYVTGKMVYTNPDGSTVGDGCDTYMRYENIIRTYESRFNSIVGVDGGIDAMRRELYQPLNADQLPDFVQPLRVIEKGYRVIYDPMAILQEETLTDTQSEYRMRVRVSLRALWALFDMRDLLNPIKFPVFSWQLFSHKVLRYLAWLPIILLLILNTFILGSGTIYVVIFTGQLMFYTAAVCGYIMRSRKNNPVYLSAPYYFMLINVAAAHAFLQFSRGKKQVLWTPRVG